jgi:hypothetical protein
MVSRLLHLTIIDILTTGVALRLGPDLRPMLQEIKKNLRAGATPGLAGALKASRSQPRRRGVASCASLAGAPTTSVSRPRPAPGGGLQQQRDGGCHRSAGRWRRCAAPAGAGQQRLQRAAWPRSSAAW